ncbi:MAG TPA: family 10 glycosylhydrolase, partial [Candidatus Dormibacteraeota bacterium]
GLFDPGVPDVLTYTHKIFMDVATRYDIDGLHMDYVRYPGAEWGYNRSAIALYQAQTGATTTPAPEDEAWKAWRRGRVTAFVRDLHSDLKRTKPNVKLSGALIAYGGGPASAADWPLTSAYGDVFQDWYAWLANKYIDFGAVMNYDSAWDSLEQAWFMRWIAFEKKSGFGNRLLAGVGGFMNYPEDTLAQIRLALAPDSQGKRLLGIAIYSYGSTSVYGNADYYESAPLAAGLPRQPYYAGTSHRESPTARGRIFNSEFMNQLRRSDMYWDVQRGWVSTKGVFTLPAAVPVLPA